MNSSVIFMEMTVKLSLIVHRLTRYSSIAGICSQNRFSPIRIQFSFRGELFYAVPVQIWTFDYRVYPTWEGRRARGFLNVTKAL